MTAASQAYEVVEADYLRLVRAGADRAALTSAADATARACSGWGAAEDARLATTDESDRPQYEQCYEMTEVLGSLRADIAAAHEGAA